MVVNVLSMVLSSTKDVINGYVTPGGPAYYSSLALLFMGFNDFIVVTNEGITSSYLRKFGVNTVSSGVGETVFEFRIDGGRTLKLINLGFMNVDRVLDCISDCVVISLTLGEIPLNTIKDLVKGRRVVIDVQGFVRSVGSDGLVFNDHYSFSELATLECEELVLRGELYEFPNECRGINVPKCVSKFNASIIITGGSGPTYFSSIDGVLGIIQPPEFIYGNTIGTGDVFTAVFAYNYLILGKSFEEAVALATSAASLRIRDLFPWYTINEVRSLGEKLLRLCKRITY